MNDSITVLEIARVELNRAVWGFLNHLMPPTYHDDDIDRARDAFIVGGLDALARFMDVEASGNVSYMRIVDTGVGKSVATFDIEIGAGNESNVQPSQR